MKSEEKDESFEIISLKEKYLRDQFAQADDNLMKSELNVKISKAVKKIVEEDLKAEAKANK